MSAFFQKLAPSKTLLWAMQPTFSKKTSSLPVLSFHISCTVTPEKDPCVVNEYTYDVLRSLFSV